jgi:hypothetical protein
MRLAFYPRVLAIRSLPPVSETVARVRIELEDTDPLVWRELDLPLSTTLATLHDLIQVVMRWQDYHLHEFVVGEKIYGVPDHEDDVILERKVYQSRSIRLGTLIDRGVREFLYVYDFGDNWRHRILIADIRQGEPDSEYPRFVAGERRAPPEDVGGIGGFEEFLEAMADPEHDQHQLMMDWQGKPFDPEDIEERWLRMIVENFAARRRGPLKSHRSGNRARD